MERHFDEDLKVLKERLLRMGNLAEEMVRTAVEALKVRDESLARQVFGDEEKINQLHIEVDELCLSLLALHQPMAVDLRLITAVMRINADLERVGDLAVNMCQTACYYLFKQSPVPEMGMILPMAEIAQRMLKESLEAFFHRDVRLAQSVLAQEEKQDRLKAGTLDKLIPLIRQNPSYGKQFVEIILISKNLERIADHATNIAEDAIFMVLGKDIRHHAADPVPAA